MAEDSTVHGLLQRALDEALTPEQVCNDTPQLLEQVREQWEQLQWMNRQLEELFPSGVGGARADVPGEAMPMPQIDGYVVDGVLGRGGMGIVYRGHHSKLNRPVAIKMLLAGGHATRQEIARFLNEARAIAALRHPNIVQVYDVGESEGRPYFTMELLPRGSLLEAITPPLSPRDATQLMTTLATAIGAAHRSGIVHRDLKPGNVLLSDDGAPKISDFGLSRRMTDAVELTASGMRMGTPGYMAPEQVASRHGTVGPAADVYALGALLYWLLTAVPPFVGESQAEIEQQLLTCDPVRPSRCNARVPRDLETICMMCLQKRPQSRYASAEALADDLHRFDRGEPIAARRANVAERSMKWARRRPAAAVLLLSACLAASGAMGGWVWVTSQRAALASAAQQDLQEAERLQRLMSWDDSNAALGRAAARLSQGGPEALHLQLERAQRNAALATRLEAIRLERAESTGGVLHEDKAESDYAALFREANIITSDRESPQVVVSRIAGSAIEPTLVDALDLWLVLATNDRHRALLMEVTQRLDPSPLRQQMAEASLYANQESIDRLVNSIDVHRYSPVLLAALGERINDAKLNAVPLLTALQRAYPGDFWTNVCLADALTDQDNPIEAIRYYQAALVIRPSTPMVLNNMANALGDAGGYDEAIEKYRLALARDPVGGIIRVNLARTLDSAGRTSEAIAFARESLELKPADPRLHLVLAKSLTKLGLHDQALNAYRAATSVPESADEANALMRTELILVGQLTEAIRVWEGDLLRDPQHHLTWDGFAELCLYAEADAAYREVAAKLLERFGDDADPGVSERTGRACLLLPSDPAMLAKATACIDRALASQIARPQPTWQISYFRVARALAAYRAGEYDAAQSWLDPVPSGVLEQAKDLVAAMAYQRQGDSDAARAKLAHAAAMFDWSPATADVREKWIYHILRREAEAMILPNLNAMLDGDEEPRDSDERLALTAAMRARVSVVAEANQWATLDQTDSPRLATCRLNAARSSIDAASGRGDAATLTLQKQSVFRERARHWMSDELAALTSDIESGQRSRDGVAKTMQLWLSDASLASVRERDPLALLDARERSAWMSLWDRARALAAAK